MNTFILLEYSYKYWSKIIFSIIIMGLKFKMETNNVVEETQFEWTIKKFSELPNFLESPPFFAFAGCSIKFKLILDFKGFRNQNFAVKVSSSDVKKVDCSPIGVKGTFIFKDLLGVVWNPCASQVFDITIKTGETITCFEMNTGCKFPKNISNFISLKDDVFIIVCAMTVCRFDTSIIMPLTLVSSNQNKILESNRDKVLKLVYHRNAYCDFTFHVGKNNIKAHKSILSVRSPVFEKMLEHDNLEKQTDSMTVVDTDFSVFDSFVGYLYTWEIKENVVRDFGRLLSLYEVSDKYQLVDLQKDCVERLLLKHLNVNTVCEIFKTADMHQDCSFKDTLMQFFHHNFPEIVKTNEWVNFLANNIQLTREVLVFVTSNLYINM